MLGKVLEKINDKMILKVIPLEYKQEQKQFIEKMEIVEIDNGSEIFEKVFFAGDQVIVIYGNY